MSYRGSENNLADSHSTISVKTIHNNMVTEEEQMEESDSTIGRKVANLECCFVYYMCLCSIH